MTQLSKKNSGNADSEWQEASSLKAESMSKKVNIKAVHAPLSGHVRVSKLPLAVAITMALAASAPAEQNRASQTAAPRATSATEEAASEEAGLTHWWNNRYPFYSHSGLVYEGLIAGRDHDQLMTAVALGQHSLKTQQAAIDKGDPVPEITTFFEVGYRIKTSGWSYLQPFFKYESRPNGTEAVANAAILGFLVGVDF
jgi:hypothetical protein